ncbi:hypothetical protein [Rhizobium leguminosarum]|uniref:hypothetical protein n=1 Tax=Rhizobium leguminosarum TaxID=384 RepID=UPI001440FC55|nr:hypothetical protein [Rhizobium leguminosarum]
MATDNLLSQDGLAFQERTVNLAGKVPISFFTLMRLLADHFGFSSMASLARKVGEVEMAVAEEPEELATPPVNQCLIVVAVPEQVGRVEPEAILGPVARAGKAVMAVPS